MKDLILNETPIRTSKNYNINNIKLDNIEIPTNVQSFENVIISSDSSKNKISKEPNNFELTYGVGEELVNQVRNKANQKIKVTIEGKTNKNINIEYKFDEFNLNLIDNVEIIANENSKATVIIKYESSEDIKCFHNGVLRLTAKENSEIDVIILNVLNSNSNNFISIQNDFESNAKVKYTIVDFGGKNSVTNYFSNLLGDTSDNKLNVIYLGKDEQLFDLNYIGELRGKKSNIDIEVQGALKDNARKHFKGTIDFKKGAKKATGNENEFCMLLSDTAKSLALPMLLCSEEDVSGNHSSSAGKFDEKELFYIMSRGFGIKEAMKLMVRARFNNIISEIKVEEIRNRIAYEIEKRLD